MPAPADNGSSRDADAGPQPSREGGVVGVFEFDRTPLHPARATGTDSDLGMIAEVNQLIVSSFGAAAPACRLSWGRRFVMRLR